MQHRHNLYWHYFKRECWILHTQILENVQAFFVLSACFLWLQASLPALQTPFAGLSVGFALSLMVAYHRFASAWYDDAADGSLLQLARTVYSLPILMALKIGVQSVGFVFPMTILMSASYWSALPVVMSFKSGCIVLIFTLGVTPLLLWSTLQTVVAESKGQMDVLLSLMSLPLILPLLIFTIAALTKQAGLYFLVALVGAECSVMPFLLAISIEYCAYYTEDKN